MARLSGDLHPGPVDSHAYDVDEHRSADEAADRRDQVAERRDADARVRAALAAAADTALPADVRQRLAAERQAAEADRLSAAEDRRAARADRRRAAAARAGYVRDGLTGLLMRGAGETQLSQAIARAHRTNEPLTVVFIDVDHLKAVNDEQGHAAGDTLLRAVAVSLRRSLRPYDVIMRFGGDEFVAVMVDAHTAEAKARLQRVEDFLARGSADASFSAGIVELLPGEDLEAVIARADRAMYGVKAQRRRVPRSRTA